MTQSHTRAKLTGKKKQQQHKTDIYVNHFIFDMLAKSFIEILSAP